MDKGKGTQQRRVVERFSQEVEENVFAIKFRIWEKMCREKCIMFIYVMSAQYSLPQ